MKIVADENIPLVNELFGEFGSVLTRAGRHISADDVHDADILLVRSVTRVNASLLAGSQIKFVGTCTIGVDHLDQTFLKNNNIAFSSAPGCNALGVVQYVVAALAQLNCLDTSKRVGIIGCGNVGGRLYRTLTQAGFDCVCYDPFLTTEQIADLQPWEALEACDIICTHTPLTTDGDYPTFHMLEKTFFKKMKQGALLLNAGRGEVVDNAALLQHFEAGNANNIRVVLDVWEPEPKLNISLLHYVSLGTPHIAGYSYEGKTNGSLMIYEALGRWLDVAADKLQARLAQVRQHAYGEPQLLPSMSLLDAILATYPIKEDDMHLRAVSHSLDTEFDLLRKHYPQRREFNHYIATDVADSERELYSALGFREALSQ